MIDQTIGLRNQLLTALPPDTLTRLMPHLRRKPIRLRTLLHAPDTPITTVYFIESGWVSSVGRLSDGIEAEVGLVGREGMIGLSMVAGIDRPYAQAYVQAHGSTIELDADVFRRTFDEDRAFRSRLLRYAEAAHDQTMQTAICNGRHTLDQRFARWLLMARDRADSDSMTMTHEFLGLMLCAHRPSISVVSKKFQDAGIISASRGITTILDHAALVNAACECYEVLRRRFNALLVEKYQ